MDPVPREISAMADELSALAKSLETASDAAATKHARAAVVMKAKSLISHVQDPMEAVMDHVTNVFVACAARALMEIGVLDAIPASGSIHISELAKNCEADESLIIRLMRQLTSVGIFTELRLGQWAHNRLSIRFSTHQHPTGKYFFEISMGEMLPSILRLPEYMRKFGKKDILTYTDTPHSWADNKLGMTFWEVLNSDPERVQSFARGLSLFDAIHPIVGIYPFEEQHAAGNSPARPLAVDIGGGRGLAMLELRARCPSLQGSLVLEDRKEVLDAIAPDDLPGVEKIEHDFFSPQPIKGAQIYYIRRVFHDWLDDEARKILTSIVPAMAPDSRILISDMAVPEPVTLQDAHAVWLDLMMLAIGGKERTKRDWESLVESAGLKLVKLWQKPEYEPLVVVECALPDAPVEDGAEAQNVAVPGGGTGNKDENTVVDRVAGVAGLAKGVEMAVVGGEHEGKHEENQKVKQEGNQEGKHEENQGKNQEEKHEENQTESPVA